MAISESLNKRLRAHRDEDEDDFEKFSSEEEMEQESHENGESDSEDAEDDSNLEEDEDDEEEEEEEVENNNDDISENESTNSADDREAIRSEFRQISFGALAKAQNAIGKKRKRGDNQSSDSAQTGAAESSSTLDVIKERLRKAREQRQQELGLTNGDNKNKDFKRHHQPPARSSKHAPTVQSSKMAVSRKRIVIEEDPNTAKSRDPRFDPTVSTSSSSRFSSRFSSQRNNSAAENAYAFLDEYRASELKQLKEQHARTKDPHLKDQLKRAITSATDRQRTLDNRKREREVLQEHKKKERQLIQEGKKSQPYYLKNSELKREVLKKKYESMGSRERSKALERKRKKVASKEKKDLPWARRGVVEN